MKLSATYKALPAVALLSMLSIAQAQPAETEPSAVTEEESASLVRILHFERPISLARLAETPLLTSLALNTTGLAESESATSASTLSGLAPTQQGYLQRLQEIDDYEQALEELEIQNGVWGVQIAEELTTLGSLLHQQGNYEEAIALFDRGVHVNRVNHGLYSLEQIPLVEMKVASHVALGQWREADEQQQYAYFVQAKAYGLRDPRMVEVFQNLANWNITSFYRGIDVDPTQRLLQTYLLYGAAADTVKMHFGASDPRYLGLLQDVAGASDLMSRYALEGVAAPTASSPERRIIREFAGYSLTPQGSRGHSGGEGALRRIIDFYSDNDRPDTEETFLLKVQAMANMGDWYLMRDRRQAALRAYREAFEEVAEKENGEVMLQQLFGEIVFLPTFSNFEEQKKEAFNIGPDSGAKQGYIDLSFDVSQYGRATNFETLAVEPPGLEGVERQVALMVRGHLVRPRIVEGRTVPSQGEQYRFHFWYY